MRNSYVLKVEEYKLDNNGNVYELVASIDEKTLGNNPEGRKVKGVIHWVSAELGVTAVVRMYEHLLVEDDEILNPPTDDSDEAWIRAHINPNSLTIYQAIVEPSLQNAQKGERFQFERESYFVADLVEFAGENLVFNQIVSLKDSFKPQ